MTFAFLCKIPFYNEIKDGKMEGGLYNGYVATDKKLPESFMSAWTSNSGKPSYELDELISVHGGITFDNLMIGWQGPFLPITAIPDPEEWSKFRVIGFDTLHGQDTKEDWDFEQVKKETLNLMKQIEEI